MDGHRDKAKPIIWCTTAQLCQGVLLVGQWARTDPVRGIWQVMDSAA